MKPIYSFLCLIFSASSILFADPTYTIIPDQSDLKIITPALANQEIRKLRLENDMEILLISDPDTPQSGAALAVGVGSWDDPKNRCGMAHFVEHMLFLGTEKYPEEDGYARFLNGHGGSRNAFTDDDRTVYSFAINNHAFLEALDRFGQFFISPLFSPSGVDRECKAIHQEHCKNVPIDMWRIYYVKKELANPDHPFHCFCCGNKDTLAKISQDELKEWYRAHYSSNMMRLVVTSSLPIDTLEKEVVSIFSNVKNRNRELSSYSSPLLLNENYGKMIAISSIQNIQKLELSWELSRFFSQDKEIHADKLVGHVLGHEGSTSLLAQLKKEKLAEGLSVNTTYGAKDQRLFTLSIDLTSKGIVEYEKVIQRCFEAIASTRQSGIPKFIFDEVKQIEEMRYLYQSREDVYDLVTNYARYMIDEPIETYPRKILIPSSYNPEKMDELLAGLTPGNCQYALIAHPNLLRTKLVQKEKWLGVDYAVITIPQEKIMAWSQVNPHPSISIPFPNHFLPENLALKEKRSEGNSFPSPTLISESDQGKIWMATDDQFLLPEISWSFNLKTPAISDANPKTHVLADLYGHAVKEKLNAVAYQAKIAGLTYSLNSGHNGMVLKINGFSDKAEEFLQAILAELKNVKSTKEEFTLYKELIQREYSNALLSSPLKQGKELLWGLLYKDYPGLLEREKITSTISYKEFNNFCQKIWKVSYVEGTLFGNLDEAEAKNVSDSVITILESSPYPPADHPKIELASLPDNQLPSFFAKKVSMPANALILIADCGAYSAKARAAQEILSKGLEEPFFSDLRTKQQTAYIVFNWSQELERRLYSFFAIQSSSHDTRDLLARFELFLETSLQNLSKETIPNERFESIRAACIQKLERPVETVSTMGALLHQLAYDYDGQFDWLEQRLKGLKELTYEEFLEYSKNFIGKENQRRLAVMVDGDLPSNTKHIHYNKISKTENLRKLIQYTARDCAKTTL